jgi:hypothetical protein
MLNNTQKISKNSNQIKNEYLISINKLKVLIEESYKLLEVINKNSLQEIEFERSKLNLLLGEISNILAKLIIKNKNEKPYIQKLGIHNILSLFLTKTPRAGKIKIDGEDMIIVESEKLSDNKIVLGISLNYLVESLDGKSVYPKSTGFNSEKLKLKDYLKSRIQFDDKKTREDIIFYYRNNFGSHSGKTFDEFYDRKNFIIGLTDYSNNQENVEFIRNVLVLESTILRISIEVYESLVGFNKINKRIKV